MDLTLNRPRQSQSAKLNPDFIMEQANPSYRIHTLCAHTQTRLAIGPLKHGVR